MSKGDGKREWEGGGGEMVKGLDDAPVFFSGKISTTGIVRHCVYDSRKVLFRKKVKKTCRYEQCI